MSWMSILLLVGGVIGIWWGFQAYQREREVQHLGKMGIGRMEAEQQVASRVSRLGYLEQVRSALDAYFRYHWLSAYVSTIYYSVIAVEGIIAISCLLLRKPIFAMVLPLYLHFFTLKLLQVLHRTVDEFIQKELPRGIKHLVKIMGRTMPMKSMMTEMANHLSSPLKDEFRMLAANMIRGDEQEKLKEFGERLNNTWIYAFVFLMKNYAADSEKRDIIKNLMVLANMMDKENNIREKAVTDKKFVTVMNYALVVVALVMLGANLIWNSYAIPFLFETIRGMLLFLFGIFCVLFTVYLNVVMMRRT